MVGRLCLLLWLSVWLSIAAFCNSAVAEPLRLPAGASQIRLSQAAQYWIDSAGTTPFNDLQANSGQYNWQPVRSTFPSFGFTDQTVWLKLELDNQAAEHSDYVLQLEYPLLDHIQFYYPDAQGLYRTIISGDRLPFSERMLVDRYFSFPLQLPQSHPVTLYFRVQSTDTLITPLVIYSQRGYESAQRTETLVMGMYYGAILVILLVNTCLFFFLRQKAQIYFVTLLGTYALMELSLNGMGNLYLWGEHPDLAKTIRPLCIGLLTILGMQLAKAYFGLRTVRMGRINMDLVCWCLGIAAIIGALVLPFRYAIQLAMLALATSGPALVGVGVHQSMRGNVAGHFYLIGWSGFIVGGTLNILRAFDLVPVNFITTYGSQIGSLMTLLVLNMGLTEQFRQVQRLREMDHERKLRQTAEANRQLDMAVHERTRELQEKTEEAERARAIAEQAVQVKSQFLATMSHEIRTPMNGVLGITQILADTPLNPHQRHLINTIRNSGDALVSIINDILDYSKIEAGKLTLEKVDFSLRDLLDECLALFASSTENSSVRLILHVEPRVPSQIQGDPTRLRQTIMNLVGNAIKFTDSGHIILHVSFRHNTNKLCIRVQDTGIGISREQQGKLFQSFSQADSSTTRKYGGTGLGLVICRSLVLLMGGTIELNSEPGIGSTFTLDLPIKVRAQAEPIPALRGKVILIADPLPAFCSALADMLISWGCSPHLASAEHLPETVDAMILSQYLPTREYESLSRRVQVPTLKIHMKSDQSRGNDIQLSEPVTQERLRAQLLFLLTGQENPAQITQHKRTYSHLRVLVAEDNPVNQMVIRGLLKKFGITPDIANDGLEAIHCAQTADTGYDLILMDCEMPNLDGYQATRQLRHLPCCQFTRIVGLSAHAMAEHRDAGLEAGMAAFLTKPIAAETLEQELIIASQQKPN